MGEVDKDRSVREACALRYSRSAVSRQLVTRGCWWPRHAENELSLDSRSATRIPAPQPLSGCGCGIAVKQATFPRSKVADRGAGGHGVGAVNRRE